MERTAPKAVGTPVPKEHKIEVRSEADGMPLCVPDELTGVRPGDRITWVGLEHSGVIQGRILGAKQRGFTAEELAAVDIDETDRPFEGLDGSWDEKHPSLIVAAGAKPGAYKYLVTVGEKTLDPVVIIDDQRGDSGDGNG
jgi:hypothetical protein